jgi:hypothetical protein
MISTIDDAVKEMTLVEREFVEHDLAPEELRTEPGYLLTPQRKYRLDGVGMERFCKQLGAPFKYLMTLCEDITAPVIQHHLDRGDLGEDRLTLIVRDGAFVAFGRRDLQRLAGGEVVGAVLEGIGLEADDLHVNGQSWADDSFQLDLLSEEMSEEMLPGDIVEAGLRITHSLIGEHATQIESFIFRLVCSNDLTHRECVGTKAVRTRRLPVGHPDARRLQIAQVGRLSREAWRTLRRKLEALRSLRDKRVDVRQYLERWLRQARLSSRNLMPSILQALDAEGSEGNAYSALNALTRVATHQLTLPLRQRRTLSALAGLIAFRNLHICPRCFSLLSDNTHGHSEDGGDTDQSSQLRLESATGAAV